MYPLVYLYGLIRERESTMARKYVKPVLERRGVLPLITAVVASGDGNGNGNGNGNGDFPLPPTPQ